MINELQLLAGTDIPFPEAQLIIHQPTLKEISYIGEDNFFYGVELLKISKDVLNTEDKISLSNYSDFDILMQIIENQSNDEILKKSIDSMFYIYMILFPDYQINIENHQFAFIKDDKKTFINSTNFNKFKEIISVIFNLHDNQENSTDYKPAGALAQKITEKLKKRHQKLAEQKGHNQKIALYSRYVSILAVGEHKDINSLMQYTIYQITDEYNRFLLKEQYDIYLKAKTSMFGSDKLTEPDDWMKDLYDEDESKKKSGLNNGKIVY